MFSVYARRKAGSLDLTLLTLCTHMQLHMHGLELVLFCELITCWVFALVWAYSCERESQLGWPVLPLECLSFPSHCQNLCL